MDTGVSTSEFTQLVQKLDDATADYHRVHRDKMALIMRMVEVRAALDRLSAAHSMTRLQLREAIADIAGSLSHERLQP